MKTETTETTAHSPKCAAQNAHLPGWLKLCRCATIAEADAAVAAVQVGMIRFVGPIGKSNPRREEPVHDVYATVCRLF